MKRSLFVLLVAVVAHCPLAPAPPAVAQEAVAEEEGGDDGLSIVRRSDDRTKSTSEREVYRMELVGADGEVEQTRRLEVYFKRTDEGERTLQKFLAPPVLEGTGMLIEDTGKEANDIWLYLPATRRIRRISGAEKSNRYLGTDFSYEDFEDYQIPFYSFTLVEEADCRDGGRCWVVRAEPATETEREASGYSKKVYWIDQESLYPVQVDLYAEDGHQRKCLTVSGLEEKDGYWRPREIVMRDLDGGGSTRLIAEEREIDQDLDAYYVSQRFLRRD